MDEITKRAKDMENKIVAAVNESQLPPVVAEYVLRNLLLQIQSIELSGSQEKKE